MGTQIREKENSKMKEREEWKSGDDDGGVVENEDKEILMTVVSLKMSEENGNEDCWNKVGCGQCTREIGKMNKLDRREGGREGGRYRFERVLTRVGMREG